MQASSGRKSGGILSGLATILILPFATVAGLFALFRSKIRSTPRDEAELARTNRQRMLQKVYDFWVVGVLENALKESGAFPGRLG